MKKLLIVLNSEKFLISHRLEIAKKAQKEKYNVIIIAPNTGFVDEIKKNNFNYIDLKLSRSSLNIINELKTLIQLIKVYKKEKPDLIHHVTLKICILGSIAAKLSNCKYVINAISGFGFAYSEKLSNPLRNLIKIILRISLKSKNFKFIVQNPDDLDRILKLNITTKLNTYLIKGSGVNLQSFSYSKPNLNEFIFLFASRMLIDKGVLDFINAAKILKPKLNNKAKFILVGNCDRDNKNVISPEQLEKMMEKDYIEYHGHQKDMIPILRRSSVVVLPSYYNEGLPKSLIEACAIGRPIITTNRAGCKETLANDNGLFVNEKDPTDLSKKMLELYSNRSMVDEMGILSRVLAEQEFDVEKVVNKHMKIYQGFE